MIEAQHSIGKLINGEAGLDAIHFAVAPVVAGQGLVPGQHIGFLPDGTVGMSDSPIGIVDPFLTKIGGALKAGERFWLFLYPNTITGLRHVWTHPAFEVQPEKTADKAASEAWLRDFAKHNDCPRYETLLAGAIRGGVDWDEEYLHFDGSDAHGNIPPEFWHHIEVVTGVKHDNPPKYFSCSC